MTTLTLDDEVKKRLALIPKDEITAFTGQTLRREYRSLPIARQRRPKMPAADASMFHEICKWLYHEHGIMAFHTQDAAVSQNLRDLMTFEGNQLYGRPGKKPGKARYARGMWE